MLTTIQLHKTIARQLLKFRESPKETYEDVIARLISDVEHKEEDGRRLLKEGYLEMAADMKKLGKEWETADAAWD